MSAPVDLAGDLALVVQVIIFFILILGLPLAKGDSSSRNYIRHGYLTVFALGLHTVLVAVVMVYLALEGFAELLSLPTPIIAFNLLHVALGFAALALAYVVVGFWLTKPIKSMACYRTRKLMWPLLIIWAISLVTGAIMHLFGIF